MVFRNSSWQVASAIFTVVFALLILTPVPSHAIGVPPTVTIADILTQPTIVLAGETRAVFSFQVLNNDTSDPIVFNNLCVNFNQTLTALSLSLPGDLDSVTVRNSATGLETIGTITNNQTCFSLAGRADSRIAAAPAVNTPTVSDLFHAHVHADTLSTGARWTMGVTNANNSIGLQLLDDTGNDVTLSASVGEAYTSQELTIPIMSVNDGDVLDQLMFISPNSDVFPIFGIRFAAIGRTPPDDINQVVLRFHNVNNFVPGGTFSDDYGDLEYIYFMKDNCDGGFDASGNRDPDGSTTGAFTEGGELIGTTYNRVLLGTNSVGAIVIGGSNTLATAAEADSYSINLIMGVSPKSSQGNDIPDITALPTSTTGTSLRGSSFYVAIETNRRFSDQVIKQGVGPGDRWFAELESITISIDEESAPVTLNFNQQLGGDTDKKNPQVRTPLITEVMTEIDSGNIIVPVHLSDNPLDFDPNSNPPGSSDNQGLDYLEFTPIFGFHMLGGPDYNVAVSPQLQRIQLRIFDPNGSLNLTNANSPLRSINNSRLSGIQLRRNRRTGSNSATIHALENEDLLVPIDPAQIVYVDTVDSTYDTMTLAFVPDKLPTESVKPEKNGSGDPLTNNWELIVISATSGNVLPFNDEYFLGVLASDRARFGDTIKFEIPFRGLLFNQGNSSDTLFVATSQIMFGPPVLPADLIDSGQVIGESSPPTAMMRLRISGNNHGESLAVFYTYFMDSNLTGIPQLSQSDFLDHDFSGGGGGTFTNDTEADGSSLSGIAIYRDMNGNGLFDQGTDLPVPFLQASINNPDSTSFIPPGSDVNLMGSQGALLARMYLDVSHALAGINFGDSNVFFLVIRSSGTIDPTDNFFAVIGDLDAVHASGQYADAEPAGITIQTNLGGFDQYFQTYTNQLVVYAGGDSFGIIDNQTETSFQAVTGWRREDHFRSSKLKGESIKDIIVIDSTAFNQTVFGGEPTVVYTVNIIGDSFSPISVTLDTIAILVTDGGLQTGDFKPSVDLNAIDTSASSGVAIFLDNGTVHGQFDAADQVAGIISGASFDALGRIEFTFSPSITIDGDASDTESGADLYIVINPSTSITFKDDFVVGMPENAFGFSNSTSKRPNGDTTQILTAGLPVILSGVGDTFINTNGETLAVIGIDAFDTTLSGDAGVNLTQVKVTFTDPGAFSLTDLASFTNDSSSGIALYRDNPAGIDGIFDTLDTFIQLTTAPSAAGFVVTMNPQVAESVPSTQNNTGDSGPDWFVVLRASTRMDVTVPDSVSVGIASGGLQWSTPFAPDTTFITGAISCTGIPPGGAFAYSPSRIFSPDTNGSSDTLFLNVSLPILNTAPVSLVVTSRSGVKYSIINSLGNGDSVQFTIDISDSLPEGEFQADVHYQDVDGDTVIGSFSDSFIVDLTAAAPSATVVATSTGSKTAKVTVAINLDPSLASGTDTQQTAFRGQLGAENSAGFSLILDANGPLTGDSITTDTQSIAASSSQNFTFDFTKNFFDGLNTIQIRIIDGVGNEDTVALTFTSSSSSSVSTDITYEGDEPMFRYDAVTNPDFTFTFAANLTGGDMAVYNASGEQLTTVPAIAGQNTILFTPKNTRGSLLKNGVYLLRFNLLLEGGGSIQQTRTIFFLK
ncbi:MAG: hypothetical protein JKX97_03765 [Candidatus Lindowbacteria bacterium]|nr:hypothetical protein [Candidatus Lindowbacteria bacterium]